MNSIYQINYLKHDYGVYGIRLQVLGNNDQLKPTPIITVYNGRIFNKGDLKRIPEKIKKENNRYKYLLQIERSYYRNQEPYYVAINYHEGDIALNSEQFFDFYTEILNYQDVLLQSSNNVGSRFRRILIQTLNQPTKMLTK